MPCQDKIPTHQPHRDFQNRATAEYDFAEGELTGTNA
eukprot:CAMPEP_0114012000 /NCGR_PEP_ID=MMETSP0372-20130328/9042_1 /TAXON_ID=340204 /ORGANISM="Lankesteria abbotti" /LENGTH=36 /assembly_acc=CAM_ASM_000359